MPDIVAIGYKGLQALNADEMFGVYRRAALMKASRHFGGGKA